MTRNLCKFSLKATRHGIIKRGKGKLSTELGNFILQKDIKTGKRNKNRKGKEGGSRSW